MARAQDKSAQDRENRQKAVELTVASIEKQFGKGSIMRMGSDGVGAWRRSCFLPKEVHSL